MTAGLNLNKPIAINFILMQQTGREEDMVSIMFVSCGFPTSIIFI